MLLRCFDRRVCVLDDDPIFARDHFERCGFPFLVESAAGFSVDDPTEMHLVEDEPV